MGEVKLAFLNTRSFTILMGIYWPSKSDFRGRGSNNMEVDTGSMNHQNGIPCFVLIDILSLSSVTHLILSKLIDESQF